jgi:hypothetical protein
MDTPYGSFLKRRRGEKEKRRVEHLTFPLIPSSPLPLFIWHYV